MERDPGRIGGGPARSFGDPQPAGAHVHHQPHHVVHAAHRAHRRVGDGPAARAVEPVPQSALQLVHPDGRRLAAQDLLQPLEAVARVLRHVGGR